MINTSKKQADKKIDRLSRKEYLSITTKLSKTQIAKLKKDRLKVIVGAINKIILLKKQNDQAGINQLLYETFSKLGGVYIKFLQHLSLQNKFFEDWGDSKKLSAFEKVEIEDIDLLEILRSRLDANQLQRFIKIDSQPFAAGSFAQVYKAQLSDGKTVVIKVLRPTLLQFLSFDLKMIKLLINSLKKSFEAELFDADQIYREFKNTAIIETKYEREAKNANYFFGLYRNHPFIKIPETYLDLSTDVFITQEYIEGESLAKLMEKQKAGIDIAEYVRLTLGSSLKDQLSVLGFELMYGSMFYKIVQGDPHPGNIRILKNNQLALIDFGIVAESPTDKIGLLDLMNEYRKLYNNEFDVQSFTVNLLKFFARDLFDSAEELKKFIKNPDNTDIITEISKASANMLEMSHSDLKSSLLEGKKVVQLFDKVINKNNRLGLKFTVESINLIKAANIYLEMIDGLGYSDILPKIFDFVSRTAEQNRDKLATSVASKRVNNTADAIDYLYNWLSEISKNDPEMFKKMLVSFKNKK